MTNAATISIVRRRRTHAVRADFCVIPNKQGLLVVVPDLVKGELRFVQLGE